MLCDAAAQTWWRFLCLEQAPLRLAGLAHPQSSESDKLDIARQLFSVHECCLDKEFSLKVRHLFVNTTDPDPDEAAQGLIKNQRFTDAIKVWSESTKLTNMHLERMLAALKLDNSISGSGKNASTPSAERLVSVGMLGQLLRAHLANGGRDPRYQTRADLRRAGVPIQADARTSETSKPPSGFVPFLAHVRNEYRELRNLTMLTREQNREVSRRV